MMVDVMLNARLRYNLRYRSYLYIVTSQSVIAVINLVLVFHYVET